MLCKNNKDILQSIKRVTDYNEILKIKVDDFQFEENDLDALKGFFYYNSRLYFEQSFEPKSTFESALLNHEVYVHNYIVMVEYLKHLKHYAYIDTKQIKSLDALNVEAITKAYERFFGCKDSKQKENLDALNDEVITKVYESLLLVCLVEYSKCDILESYDDLLKMLKERENVVKSGCPSKYKKYLPAATKKAYEFLESERIKALNRNKEDL